MMRNGPGECRAGADGELHGQTVMRNILDDMGAHRPCRPLIDQRAIQ